MTEAHVKRINSAAFLFCLSSLIGGIAIGLLGVWGMVATTDYLLWKALGSCGIIFVGAICASLAIRCFKTNESQ
jgi:uncharacterized membrane-anchored protein